MAGAGRRRVDAGAASGSMMGHDVGMMAEAMDEVGHFVNEHESRMSSLTTVEEMIEECEENTS